MGNLGRGIAGRRRKISIDAYQVEALAGQEILRWFCTRYPPIHASASREVLVLVDGVRLVPLLIRHHDAILLAPTSVDGHPYSPAGDRYYASMNAASVDQYGIETSWHLRLAPRFGLLAVGLAVLGKQANPEGVGLPRTTPAQVVADEVFGCSAKEWGEHLNLFGFGTELTSVRA